MKKTKIEWCDCTINPVVGCTYKCSYCYARQLNNRFKFIEDFSKPQFYEERLKQLNLIKSQVIFMNSMSDIADWENEWIIKTNRYLKEYKQHNYLFLTKRINEVFKKQLLYLNAWIGSTITCQLDIKNDVIKFSDFLSIEPILGKMDLQLRCYNHLKIKWVILGAETGNRKNKVIPKKEWIDSIVKECTECNIPIFMKDSLIKIVGEQNMIREFPKEFGKEGMVR